MLLILQWGTLKKAYKYIQRTSVSFNTMRQVPSLTGKNSVSQDMTRETKTIACISCASENSRHSWSCETSKSQSQATTTTKTGLCNEVSYFKISMKTNECLNNLWRVSTAIWTTSTNWSVSKTHQMNTVVLTSKTSPAHRKSWKLSAGFSFLYDFVQKPVKDMYLHKTQIDV